MSTQPDSMYDRSVAKIDAQTRAVIRVMETSCDAVLTGFCSLAVSKESRFSLRA